MKVSPLRKPLPRPDVSTEWMSSTPRPRPRTFPALALWLFVLASAATLTGFVRDPFASWAYELIILLLAAYCSARQIRAPRRFRANVPAAVLAAISLWGFGQLAGGATVYRYATWAESLRVMAFGATFWVAAGALAKEDFRLLFLSAFAWFGFALSLLSVIACFTSAGRVLWIFASPYPDVWGPFLSRNDFAGFLELSFPVAMWLSFNPRRLSSVSIPASPGSTISGALGARFFAGLRLREVPLWVPAWMLAAGLASGSRAGAILLLTEAALILGMLSRRRAAAQFIMAAILLASAAGAGSLAGRFAEKDPWHYRRELAASTMRMIADHPWQGYGLGTFPYVYPAYASFDLGASVEHAHNYWLEWAAEGGIPLAVLWAVLAVSVTIPAVRSVWGIGILALFLHALVDYPFARVGLTAWYFALTGALSASAVRKVRPSAHYATSAKEHW